VRRLALLAALASGLPAGCGGDGDGGGKARRSVTVPAGGAVRVVGREYSFDPAAVVVPGASRAAPVSVTLTLDNRGSLAHNLKVVRDGRELGGTPTFQGGRTASGTVRLAPGAYQLVCTVGDHAQLGMKGTLEVR
jgi:plastocyanin